MSTSIIAIIVVIINSFFNAIGQLFFKKGADKLERNFYKIVTNKFILAGITIYILGTVVFVGALRYGELSVLYPFVATNYIWVSLLASKYLGEKMNLIKWLGISLIIIGVFAISLGI